MLMKSDSSHRSILEQINAIPAQEKVIYDAVGKERNAFYRRIRVFK